MIKTDLVSNLPSGMQERVNNAGSDMEKWLAERKERAKYIKDLSLENESDSEDGIEFYFVNEFITGDLRVEISAIAKDFFANCADVCRQVDEKKDELHAVDYFTGDYDKASYGINMIGDQFSLMVIHYLYYGTKLGNEFCKKQLIALHRIFHKKEYNSIKRFSKLTGYDIFDILGDDMSDGSAARIIIISRLLGIEVEKDRNFEVICKLTNKHLRESIPKEKYSKIYDDDYHDEDCYSLIRKRKIRCSDNTVIDIDSTDCMIDLSPCIGIYQEASFFKKYDIMQQIEYVKDFHDDKALLQLKPGATMEDKVLFLTAYETKQDRYYCQVKPPFITDEQAEAIHKRLATEFTGNENVQQDFTMNLSDASDVPYCICGRPDVIKNNTVFELKFVNELEHKHFLQCAVYMVAFGLKKGILWNVKTNERYSISIPDEEMFIQAVMKTVTKGSAKRAYIETCYCAKKAS